MSTATKPVYLSRDQRDLARAALRHLSGGLRPTTPTGVSAQPGALPGPNAIANELASKQLDALIEVIDSAEDKPEAPPRAARD